MSVRTIICETCDKPMGNPACPVCRLNPPPAPVLDAGPVLDPAPVLERRRAPVQEPRIDGQRRSDPKLTTRDCADRLGVTTAFILGEIQDGRLSAQITAREGYRTIYRVAPQELEAYIHRHRWQRGRAKASKATNATVATDATDATHEPLP